MIGGIRAYARHAGKAHTTVLEAIQRGHITRRKDGKLDFDQADREWRESIAHRGSVPSPPPTAAMPPADQAQTSYSSSRAVRERYKALKEKLEFEELEGKLIRRDLITIQAFESGRSIRDGVLNVPDRICALLAAESSERVVRAILMDELTRVLLELSDTAVYTT